MQTKFKTLMYLGNYVDVNLLHKGIYTSIVPFLYDINETTNNISKRYTKFYRGHTFKENIEKCELVEVEMIINK